MEDQKFLGELFDRKLMTVITRFMENTNSNLYLREVAKQCSVSPASTYRILKRLTELKIIKVNQINRFKFYQLDDNERVKQLSALVSRDPLDRFVSRAKALPGVKAIMLYGSKKETGANVMIIGDNIGESDLQPVIKEIKSGFNFDIGFLAFSVEQFEQMSSMGMYSQPKKVLWKSI
jgi:DNA-binding transcriptional regulator YhcF (GntR family)